MTEHTPTPWFVSGVRFRMKGGEWQSINRYDESKKRDENIACVGYDPRTGLGRADAHFIVKAVNNHDALVKALTDLSNMYSHAWDCVDGNLVMLGPSIERFEKAHHAAQVALCAVTGAPLPISDEDIDDPASGSGERGK